MTYDKPEEAILAAVEQLTDSTPHAKRIDIIQLSLELLDAPNKSLMHRCGLLNNAMRDLEYEDYLEYDWLSHNWKLTPKAFCHYYDTARYRGRFQRRHFRLERIWSCRFIVPR